MTYPNPAGYYLPLPEAIEAEITALDYEGLTQTLADLGGYLNSVLVFGFEFQGVYTSHDFVRFVNDMKETDLIALIRWVAEIVATKANG